jgi:hypothetical protein
MPEGEPVINEENITGLDVFWGHLIPPAAPHEAHICTVPNDNVYFYHHLAAMPFISFFDV